MSLHQRRHFQLAALRSSLLELQKWTTWWGRDPQLFLRLIIWKACTSCNRELVGSSSKVFFNVGMFYPLEDGCIDISFGTLMIFFEENEDHFFASVVNETSQLSFFAFLDGLISQTTHVAVTCSPGNRCTNWIDLYACLYLVCTISSWLVFYMMIYSLLSSI